MHKIMFSTVDLEITLAEIEYAYLKYACHANLQTSDELLRSLIRSLQIPGLPTFEQWRNQQTTTTLKSTPIETATASFQEAEEEEEEAPSTTRMGRRGVSRKQFDPDKLKPEFRGKSVQQATQIVLAQSPDYRFSVDELLSQLYGDFANQELSKGRRSLGKVLSNGAKQKLWQRAQEKPPLYQASIEGDVQVG